VLGRIRRMPCRVRVLRCVLGNSWGEMDGFRGHVSDGFKKVSQRSRYNVTRWLAKARLLLWDIGKAVNRLHATLCYA
jgi:hypothetical protein